MKTLKKVPIEPVFVEFIPEQLEAGKLYISEKYKAALHLCLCGCGEIVSTPLTRDGWELVKFPENKVTLSPSIGNYSFPCKSHYIIVKNVANFV